MKKIVLPFLLISGFIAHAQQADRLLDYIETKAGEKLYGKIVKIDPKTGVSIQQYGSGETVVLTHEEIEKIQLVPEVNGKKQHTHRIYWTSVSLNHTHSIIEKNPNNEFIFSDSIGNYGFSRFGYELAMNFLTRKHTNIGFFVGQEIGRNYQTVPFGLNLKIGKVIKEKNFVYLNLKTGGVGNYNKIGGFFDRNGNFHETEWHSGDITGIIDI